ncbi:N-acyl-D-amino-acid deacylase family protein [Georgenia sp. Z1491]|uniref:N-acyl-D-amino-acid deacylase family protein n=1 Tax=Georgenia sp. Z1491 TaxID=3416707 RepID=UPI003CF89A53
MSLSEEMSEVDLLLVGATLADGTGAPLRAGTVGVDDGRVVLLLRPDAPEPPARERIDLTGLVLAPGFVDIHSHADFSLWGSPAATTVLTQGVTTLVSGNCGWSPFPHDGGPDLPSASSFFSPEVPWDATGPGSFARTVQERGTGVGLALQVGHSALRLAAVGPNDRPATVSEIDVMRGLLADAAAQGARGYSTGLTYAPCSFATTQELVAVAEVAAELGLTYSTHVRNEAGSLLEAVDEALAITRATGVRTQISHLKALGAANHGRVHEAIALIEAAVDEGFDVGFDVYPYTASSTTLTSRLPAWAMAAGVDGLLEILSDDRRRSELSDQLDAGAQPLFEPDRLVVAAVGGRDAAGGDQGPAGVVGRSLSDVARDRGTTPGRAAAELLRRGSGAVTVVAHAMAEADVEAVLTHPLCAVASDGWVLRARGAGHPHPRNFGTFPRVLGRYVRERGLLDLPEAVRRMTSLPASRFALADRGVLGVGARADLVAFDPRTIADRSTFEEPWELSDGVEHVWVGGRPAVVGGRVTDSRHGTVITDRPPRPTASDHVPTSRRNR